MIAACVCVNRVCNCAAVAAVPVPGVDRYAVTYDSPRWGCDEGKHDSTACGSLGAMPLGNGRASAGVWVDDKNGDLMLNIGLADALDENSNLLKLGIVRVRLDPPLEVAATDFKFNQTLVLSTATVEIHAGAPTPSVRFAVWVDANTSAVRVSVTTAQGKPRMVTALLDHEWRLNATVNAGAFGNGWGGSGGSFCTPDGDMLGFNSQRHRYKKRVIC